MPPTCPPHFLWWAESFKINGLPPPTRLVGGKSVDFKGKNANIRGGHHTYPPSPLSASGTGGVWFCGARQHLGLFIK